MFRRRPLTHSCLRQDFSLFTVFGHVCHICYAIMCTILSIGENSGLHTVEFSCFTTKTFFEQCINMKNKIKVQYADDTHDWLFNEIHLWFCFDSYYFEKGEKPTI